MFNDEQKKKLIPLIVFFPILLLTAFWITSVTTIAAIKVLSAILILVIAFFSVETALYLVILSMLLSPEIVVAKTAARDITLRLEDILLPIIGMSWFAKTAIHKDLGLVLKTPLNRPILLYVLANLISTALGMLFGRVGLASGFFYLLKYVEFFIIFFMVTNHITTDKQARNFTIAILATAGMVSLYAIFQIPMGERVTAPFEGLHGEPNTLGGYLSLILSITIGFLVTQKEKRAKMIFSGLLLLLTIPFLYTLSRSSWMAFGGMFVYFLIKSQKRLFFVLVLILLIPLVPFILPQEVKVRYSDTFSERPSVSSEQVKVGGYYLDLSASKRINSWVQILKDWRKKPLFGYGITGYSFMDGQFFRTLIETGLIGLFTFIYLIYNIVRHLNNALSISKIPFYKGLYTGLLAGIVALCAHAVGTNTFIIVRIMEPFWFLMGIAIILPGIEKTTEA